MATSHKARINELITSLGISKNKFAKAIGTSSAVISKITTTDVNYGVELAEKIISTFPSVNPSWLLSGIGEMMLAELPVKPPVETPVNKMWENSGGSEKKPEKAHSAALETEKPRQEASKPKRDPNLKRLQDYQNKLSHELRREDGELWELKNNLEYLSWVFEDARRTMEELEVQYTTTYTWGERIGETVEYDLFKALAVSELKRRLKYREIIKEFAQTVGEFTIEVSIDKLRDEAWERDPNDASEETDTDEV